MSTHETKSAPPLHIGPEDAGRPLTGEEFANADFQEGWIYERVNGRIVVMAPEGKGHIRSSSPWRDRLVAYKLAHPEIVEDVVSRAWVRPDGDHDRIGDIGVYLVHEKWDLDVPDQPPDLMFEFVSPGKASQRRDYVEKRAEYHRMGIPEYVIVDRFQKTVSVLTHGPGDYRERVLTIDDTYTTPLLPGFEVRLSEVL